MGLLEITFSTADRNSNLRSPNRVADFEDIIRLDYCQPSRWIHRERGTTDTSQTSTALRQPDNRHLRDRIEHQETRFWESAIVCFRRQK